MPAGAEAIELRFLPEVSMERRALPEWPVGVPADRWDAVSDLRFCKGVLE